MTLDSQFARSIEDQDRALVILIGTSGPDGDHVRDLLTLWARAELIRPCYWLTPQEDGAGVVEALRLDDSGATKVSLPEDLGSVAWSSCRVVLVQLVAPEIAPDGSVVSFGEQYAHFLARTVLTGTTTLLRINLVIPASNAVEADPGLLVSGWEQTVIVSPEQRASPEHANVLVLHGRKLSWACCGFRGLGCGPVDRYGRVTDERARPRVEQRGCIAADDAELCPRRPWR